MTAPYSQAIDPSLPPLESACAPRGIAIEPLPQGGVRVVLNPPPTPAAFVSSLLPLVLGGATVLWSYSTAGALSQPGTRDLALAVGLVLAGLGSVLSALSVWSFFKALTCVATPGHLDIFRGAGHFRPRLVASLGEGPIDAIRTVNHHQQPGPLRVQVRVPFVAEAIALYSGERDAAWVAHFLAKETGWQAFVSPDAGHRDLRA